MHMTLWHSTGSMRCCDTYGLSLRMVDSLTVRMRSAICMNTPLLTETLQSDATQKVSKAEVADAHLNNRLQLRIMYVDSDEVS
jgi:hypothetical protein